MSQKSEYASYNVLLIWSSLICLVKYFLVCFLRFCTKDFNVYT